MLYWNSRSLPELNGLNFRERMQLLRNAADSLPTPQKLLLNLLKLAVLIPLFLLIARAPDLATAALYVLALVLLYPLITRPLTFLSGAPFVSKNPRQFGSQILTADVISKASQKPTLTSSTDEAKVLMCLEKPTVN